MLEDKNMMDDLEPKSKMELEVDEQVSSMMNESLDITTFNTHMLAQIASTPLLDHNDKMEMEVAKESMIKSFSNSQVFRTETEARISVLNETKFPTPASKYYQCLRELNVHQSELLKLMYTYETQKLDLMILEADIRDLLKELEDVERETDKIRLKAKIAKKKLEISQIVNDSLPNMKRVADGRKREIMMWDKIIKEVEPELIKRNIPINDPDAHQLISYTVRFIRQAVGTVQSKGNITPGEINNLLGQLFTSLKQIETKQLSECILDYLRLDETMFIIKQNCLPSLTSTEHGRDMLCKKLTTVVGKPVTYNPQTNSLEWVGNNSQDSVEQPQISPETKNEKNNIGQINT